MPGRLVVMVHGGAQARQADRDGPEAAGQVGLEELERGRSPLDAAVAAVRFLEDDGRFNAGSGSLPRIDGETIEMDAACSDGPGRFGAVAGLRTVRNPVLVARAVLGTPHNLLAGEGAETFARQCGLAEPRRPSPAATAAALGLRSDFLAGAPAPLAWTPRSLARSWNYRAPPPDCDTVGAIATDGASFAAAASTGGIVVALRGRVSDVAMLGCGIHVGPAGAVAVTGHGEHLARILASWRVHDALERGARPKDAAQALLAVLPDGVSAGVIVLGREGHAALTNCTMPWAAAVG